MAISARDPGFSSFADINPKLSFSSDRSQMMLLFGLSLILLCGQGTERTLSENAVTEMLHKLGICVRNHTHL